MKDENLKERETLDKTPAGGGTRTGEQQFQTIRINVFLRSFIFSLSPSPSPLPFGNTRRFIGKYIHTLYSLSNVRYEKCQKGSGQVKRAELTDPVESVRPF